MQEDNQDRKWLPVPPEITWWDYNQRLEFGRVIPLDMDRVRKETCLPSETDIRLTCTLFCPDSHLRHHVFKSAEPIEEEEEEAPKKKRRRRKKKV